MNERIHPASMYHHGWREQLRTQNSRSRSPDVSTAVPQSLRLLRAVGETR
jgi:hypothetical protein